MLVLLGRGENVQLLGLYSRLLLRGSLLCTSLTTYKYTGQQVPIVSAPCADVVAICQPLGQTNPGEKYVDRPHPCGRHSLVFPGPRLAQKSSSLMLRTQKLLRHSPGGVKVVVRGRGDPIVVVMVAYVTEIAFEMLSTDLRSKEIRISGELYVEDLLAVNPRHEKSRADSLEA